MTITIDTTRTRRFVDALKRLGRSNEEEWIRKIEASARRQELLHDGGYRH